MEDTLITFKTAKLAKEKGFREECHSYYFEDGEFREYKIESTYGYYGEDYTVELDELYNNWNDSFLTKKDGNRCFGCDKNRGYFETFSAPTIAEVMMWLQDKQIDLCHIVNYKKGVKAYRMGIVFIKNNMIESTFLREGNLGVLFKEFATIDEAYNAGIVHVLKELL